MRVFRKKVESVEPSEQLDDDIVIINDGNVNSPDETVENTRNFYRVKLLQFHENTRPPYFGTWRKKSKYISPRNPFKRDSVSIKNILMSGSELVSFIWMTQKNGPINPTKLTPICLITKHVYLISPSIKYYIPSVSLQFRI